MSTHEVVIVGGGVAGLAAARRLADLGVKDVVVLEREAQAGGVPRHCGHLGFGWRAFRRIWRGPRFAAELRESVANSAVRAGTTVLELQPGGALRVRERDGVGTIAGRRVLVATGVRETPRAARLVGGTRPAGVMTTGALQQFVYLEKQRPFARPVIVGSEWVAFSALLTCRHLGMRPVALIEQGARITAPRPGDWIACALLGVPVLTLTRLLNIEGDARVQAVEIECNGRRERLACDGVVFTGRFVAECALFTDGPFARDLNSGGPAIDQFFRCSDPTYFAAGNALHPVETADWCWADGVAAAEAIAADMRGALPAYADAAHVAFTAPLKYVYPQRVARGSAAATLYARVAHAVRGRLRVLADGLPVSERRITALPERRIAIPLSAEALRAAVITIEIAT